MVARNDQVPDSRAASSAAAAAPGHTTGDEHRFGRRLRAAKTAAGQVQEDALQLLRLRRRQLGGRMRQALWSAATTVIMGLLWLLVAGTATIMVMIGAATTISGWIGSGPGVGLLIVGSGSLLLLALALNHARRGPDPARQAAAETRAWTSMRGAAGRLVQAVGKVPSLLISTALGFLAVRMMNHRPLRRMVLAGMGALRAANRASQTTPEVDPAPAAADPSVAA